MQGITSSKGSPPWQPSKRIRAEQLIAIGFRHLSGPLSTEVHHVALPQYASEHALVFLSKPHLSELTSQPGILIVDSSLADQGFPLTTTVFLANPLKKAMADVLPLFDFKPNYSSSRERAAVSATARIGKNVHLSPFCVIEDDAIVEDDVFVGPGVVIESGAMVGQGSRLHANVVIGHHCRIGRHCILNANTTIGSDGFGYLQSQKGPQIKIPQIGIVIVEDHCEFGGNCAIDRATIGATLIREGCKFDNLCHVAHNCELGPHGLYAGNFSVAGSSKIGSHFMCGGHVAVADHVTITDHVALGGRSAVTKDITEPGAYTGYPLEPMKEGLKTLANLRELSRLRKDIAAIKKHLNLEDL